MADKIQDVVKNLLGGMHSIAKTETLVGEPVQLGDATIIPIHRLRVGFVAGTADAGGKATASEGKVGGRAVGGMAQLDPVAVLAIGPDGRPRLLPVDGESEGTWQGLLRDAPDLLARLTHKLADRLEVLASRGIARVAADPAAAKLEGSPKPEPPAA